MVGFSLPVFALTLFVIAVVGFLVTMSRKKRAAKEALARIVGGQWIDAQKLASEYVREDGSFAESDGPGCYVIAVYDHEVDDGNFEGYLNVYVGKGERVYESACKRMAGILYGEMEGDEPAQPHVYVQVRFYDQDTLDKMERTITELLLGHEGLVELANRKDRSA